MIESVRLFVVPRQISGLRKGLGRVPREQKMLKGHLPGVIYLQVYNVYKNKLGFTIPLGELRKFRVPFILEVA